MAEILIIEDDKAIQNLLKLACKKEGYEVKYADYAQEGIIQAQLGSVDLIILDLGLPDMDGINVIKKVRESLDSLPIIVVSARGDETEKISCLDAGANDYVQKPFSTAELLARVRAALRTSSHAAGSPEFINGGLKIDYNAHSVYLNGREVHVTNYEYKILCVLARNLGKTLTHN